MAPEQTPGPSDSSTPQEPAAAPTADAERDIAAAPTADAERDIAAAPTADAERDIAAAPTADAERDIAEVPAVEIVTTVALHLMTAAAVKCGLGEEGDDETDLAEARILINALAALVTASAGDLGTFHAGPLRDGLKSLQLAFREASAFPDEPGKGPGERFTGPVA